MIRPRLGGRALIYGAGAGVLLLLALGLIVLGLARMSAPGEGVSFRSACQGDDACRQALSDRWSALQKTPGGAAARLREALTRSAPTLAPDATLAACQAGGPVESCAVDPTQLKPGEAGAVIAILDADSLEVARQGSACGHVQDCDVRALAGLGAEAFDPERLQGALQRTTYPLQGPLKTCADAGVATVRADCDAGRLLRAAPDVLAVALEQDWRSAGDQARLPQPPDPQDALMRNALWAGLGVALGLALAGLIWTGVAVARPLPMANRGRAGPRPPPDASDLATPFEAASTRRSHGPADEPFRSYPTPASRDDARPPAAPIAPSPSTAAAAHRPLQAPPDGPVLQPGSSSPKAFRTAETAPPETVAPKAVPAPLAAFHSSLSLPGSAERFAGLAEQAGARLPSHVEPGERLAAGAILAAHRLRGDQPEDGHATAYDALVAALAGPAHRLVWPPAGSPITADMDACDDGELYSHTVEAVVRPGLADPTGRLLLRPRVRAR